MATEKISDHDIEEVFSLFDTDGSGELTAEELLFALKSFSPPDGEFANLTIDDATQMIQKATGSSDPEALIDLMGFKKLIRNSVPSADSPEEAAAAFKLFDVSKSQMISRADLRKGYFLVQGGDETQKDVALEQKLDELFRVADANSDGFITLDEWQDVLAKARRK